MKLQIYIYCASLATAGAIFCIFLWFTDFVRKLSIDKIELTEEEQKEIPILIKLMLPFKLNVMFIARSNSFDFIRQVSRDQLLMSGFDQVLDELDFVASKILAVIFGLLCVVASFFVLSPIYGVIVGSLLMFYPSLWIRSVIKKRHLQIMKALPNILDLLTLSVAAGKDFLTSLRDITARRENDALNEELTRTLHEIQIGKKRSVALQDLCDRVKLSDLTTIMSAVIKAEELGVSVGDILRIQSDLLRSKRFSLAEKMANEAPVKILFPMVIFIFPVVFIILLAPLAMQIAGVFK
ncbi:type II secretion system F family protein [Lentisphaerota bacterium WC36G]|nr:type II secretion system F family protein [Lentisphaerae bacterium WC36]